MIEIVYRFDREGRHTPDPPADAVSARKRLEDGNHEFAILNDPLTCAPGTRRLIRFDADDLGLPNPDGSAPKQQPFAAVLGCADARVPTEMVFSQGCNDLFVVRVAGNVLGSECLGSLDYGLTHVGDSLKLIAVVGHSRCGAVTAAVDAFLEPAHYLTLAPSHPLRAVEDRILVAVRGSTRARTNLGTDCSCPAGLSSRANRGDVGLNAALTAATLRQEFRDQLGPHRDVVYGFTI